MGTEEDLYIEVDGKRIIFTTKTITSDVIEIPELSVVHRAVVAAKDGRYNVTVSSISGNAIGIGIYDIAAGTTVTGADISGTLIDVVAAGA